MATTERGSVAHAIYLIIIMIGEEIGLYLSRNRELGAGRNIYFTFPRLPFNKEH